MKKVWAYTIGKELNETELHLLISAGQNFVSSWTAHENKLSAEFSIYKNRIILVKVDEAVYNASGCSIDKLVRFIKTLESDFNVELLNRLLVPYQHDDKIEVIPTSVFREKLNAKQLDENTQVYITSVADEKELLGWQQPVKNTWLSKYL